LAAPPVDVDSLKGSVETEFAKHGALIIGTPTWNTGADTQRSGTGWDELYYSDKLPASLLRNKKVAVFGLGDQISYGENYADATGELYDVFAALGCDMVHYAHVIPDDSYEHSASKSIRDDKFCGLLLDEINQEDLTDGRIAKWVEQLRDGGFFDETTAAAAATTTASATAAPAMAGEQRELVTAASSAVVLDATTIHAASQNAFTPHFNPKSNKTMWTSPDGRKSYVTAGPPPSGKTGGLQP
jgi:flavodoxin long chain